jgi:hypothetical protein
MKPYDANLRIVAAKIIEPAKGASACALNNHKCAGYSGDFTANAKKKAKKAQPCASIDKSNKDK